MNENKIVSGPVHKLPPDLRTALSAAPNAKKAWHDITPLARNEWICWTVTTKKPATRKVHIERVIKELQDGQRRPCCWAGCPHRVKKA